MIEYPSCAMEPLSLTVYQDLFLSVLNSSSTKREAKSYLSRFKPLRPLPGHRDPNERSGESHVSTNKYRHGVNLGNFYAPTRAVEQSPVFAQQALPEQFAGVDVEPLHVALVKIRAPQLLSDAILKGIGLTLSQLNQLGLPSAVVMDGNVSESGERGQPSRGVLVEQADRVVAGIEANGTSNARRVDGIISVVTNDRHGISSHGRREMHILPRSGLVHPLKRGTISVIPPIAYDERLHQVDTVDPDAVVLALTRELAGLSPGLIRNAFVAGQALQKEISLDRLIILDPLGGLPSTDTSRGGHIFINMEQEFLDIQAELTRDGEMELSGTQNSREEGPRPNSLQDFGRTRIPTNITGSLRGTSNGIQNDIRKQGSINIMSKSRHLSNLRVLQQALAMLPPSSSALLTTPENAAASADLTNTSFQAAGVGTRRQRNTLIHNLLTDKPPFSSSLPVGRVSPSSGDASADASNGIKPVIPATFVKRGLPLTIIPDPRETPWRASGPESRVSLHDPRIDLSRLVDLIEDSFGRKLDLSHYLARVNDRIAGVIIAGEYEGGALLTWETPPGLGSSEEQNDDDEEEATRRRLVPYLDKFAVRKRSQGAGGVADMVFTAMVRGCFPDGVCWRSRKDNPVNKWYFERARGTWKLPHTNWTMFWTNPELGLGSGLFADYEAVCRSVEPSWADNKHVVD